MTRILLTGPQADAFDLALLAVILASAHACGPPWTWPAQWRAATRPSGRRAVPTPRHSLRAGRRDVVEVCAELDATCSGADTPRARAWHVTSTMREEANGPGVASDRGRSPLSVLKGDDVAQAIVGDAPTGELAPCGYARSAERSAVSTVAHHAGTRRKIEAASDFDLIDAGHFVTDFAGMRARRVAEGYHGCPCAGSLAEHPGECGRACDWPGADCPRCYCRCTVACGCPCAAPRMDDAQPVGAGPVQTVGQRAPWDRL